MIKVIKLVLICQLYLTFTCAFAVEHKTHDNPLIVNIISKKIYNGKGKENDAMILKSELEELGHQVHIFDCVEENKSIADINIFLAQFSLEWFSYAKLNWFIPNAEFYFQPLDDLLKFDLILCKTLESQRIFTSICKTFYLGFTSLDRLALDIPKDFKRCFHLAGGSRMKGTEEVFQAWNLYPKLPNLHVIMYFSHQMKFFPKNVKVIPKRVSSKELMFFLNHSGIHICPSKTEGFGHYIMEGMSAGSVVVTVDAPPMNEFIKDKRCLVKYTSTQKKQLATSYIVDVNDLANKIKKLQNLPYKMLHDIGQQNRNEFLKKRDQFKRNFHTLIKSTEQLMQNRKNI